MTLGCSLCQRFHRHYALLNPKTSVMFQKSHPHIGNMNSETSGDSETAFYTREMFQIKRTLRDRQLCTHAEIVTHEGRMSWGLTGPVRCAVVFLDTAMHHAAVIATIMMLETATRTAL